MKAFDKENSDRGFSIVELIIVIAIMAVLVGILTPTFVKYVDKARKSKDIYTAGQIARAVNIAFVENPEAYDAYKKWGVTTGGLNVRVSAKVKGVTSTYNVDLVCSSGTQSTNTVSNCFNGGVGAFNGGRPDGSAGFYGVINRELGLSTTEMNSAITPKFSKKKEGSVSLPGGFGYEDIDRYRICKRKDNGQMEIWAAQPYPWGGYPVYRLWPEPDDFYRE